MFSRRPTTVDEAISPLLQAVSDLEGVSDLCFEKIKANKEQIARLAVQNTFAHTEKDRALAVLTSLRSITNPEKD